VHVLQLLQFNTHGITESTDHIAVDKKLIGEFENRVRIVGNALYPTFALFNHSCNNNTYKYFAGNTVVVIASKNIRKGDEITEGYFPSVQCIPRSQRRAWLADHYRFDCQCDGCVKNLPTLQDIPKHCLRFCCSNLGCKGSVEENSKCAVCGHKVDVDKIKIEIEQIKETLEMLRMRMVSNENQDVSEETYEETRKVWTRLQQLALHPYKLLYKAEQIFWKALRLGFGNSAYE